MAPQDTVVLSGTYESRVTQLLQVVRHQARLAQADAMPRLHNALIELDYILEDQLVAIANAAVDDKADAQMASIWID